MRLSGSKENEEHLNKLESMWSGSSGFSRTWKESKGKTCGNEGLIEEGPKCSSEGNESARCCLIGAAQRVEHYEIVAYGTVRSFASLLGKDSDAEALQETLDEEGETDKRLIELAQKCLNLEASSEVAA
jgi:ferritin-like metal-binding protein YciE